MTFLRTDESIRARVCCLWEHHDDIGKGDLLWVHLALVNEKVGWLVLMYLLLLPMANSCMHPSV